jgi:hypothetical protein
LVIEVFNDRFFVPFKLTAKNRTLVIWVRLLWNDG